MNSMCIWIVNFAAFGEVEYDALPKSINIFMAYHYSSKVAMKKDVLLLVDSQVHTQTLVGFDAIKVRAMELISITDELSD